MVRARASVKLLGMSALGHFWRPGLVAVCEGDKEARYDARAIFTISWIVCTVVLALDQKSLYDAVGEIDECRSET